MPHRARNIYQTMYSITLVVAVCFFAHNMFEPMHYDVLHIEETFYIGDRAFHIHDLFPFYDAPAAGNYGEVVRMDLQIYLHRLGDKIIRLALLLGMYRLMAAFNVLAVDIPGRQFVQKPWFLLVYIGLFTYDLLDFVFTAGQTPWVAEAIVFVLALVLVVIAKRETNA